MPQVVVQLAGEPAAFFFAGLLARLNRLCGPVAAASKPVCEPLEPIDAAHRRFRGVGSRPALDRTGHRELPWGAGGESSGTRNVAVTRLKVPLACGTT